MLPLLRSRATPWRPEDGAGEYKQGEVEREAQRRFTECVATVTEGMKRRSPLRQQVPRALGDLIDEEMWRFHNSYATAQEATEAERSQPLQEEDDEEESADSIHQVGGASTGHCASACGACNCGAEATFCKWTGTTTRQMGGEGGGRYPRALTACEVALYDWLRGGGCGKQ